MLNTLLVFLRISPIFYQGNHYKIDQSFSKYHLSLYQVNSSFFLDFYHYFFCSRPFLQYSLYYCLDRQSHYFLRCFLQMGTNRIDECLFGLSAFCYCPQVSWYSTASELLLLRPVVKSRFPPQNPPSIFLQLQKNRSVHLIVIQEGFFCRQRIIW